MMSINAVVAPIHCIRHRFSSHHPSNGKDASLELSLSSVPCLFLATRFVLIIHMHLLTTIMLHLDSSAACSFRFFLIFKRKKNDGLLANKCESCTIQPTGCDIILPISGN